MSATVHELYPLTKPMLPPDSFYEADATNRRHAIKWYRMGATAPYYEALRRHALLDGERYAIAYVAGALAREIGLSLEFLV